VEFKKEFSRLKNQKKFTYLRYVYLSLIIILIIIILVFKLPFDLSVLLFLVLVFFVLGFYLFLFIKSVEAKCLVKTIPVKNLVPGDWITSNPTVNNEKFVCATIGVTEEQIAYLKKHKVKEVETTEGIAFVPAFLIAFIFLA